MKQLPVLLLLIILLSACREGHVSMQKSKADSIVSVEFAADTNISAVQKLQRIDEAQKFFKATNDRRGNGKAYIKRAVLYFETGQTDDVLEELNKAKPYINDLDTLTLITYYRANAILLTEKNIKPKEAEGDMRKAIQLGLKQYDAYRAAVDMGNLAELYIRQGRYEDARRELKTMRPITAGKPAGFQVQRDYCEGLLQLHDRRPDSAYYYFNSCYNGAKEWNVPSLEISAMKELSGIDSLRKDYRAFSLHYPLYIQLRDKVMGRQTVEQLNFMKAKQNIQQLEIRHKAENRVSRLLLALAVVIVLFLAILSWLLVRRNTQNQKIALLTKEQMENKMHTQSLEKELLELKLKNDRNRIETVQREKAAVSLQLAAVEKSGSEGNKQVKNYAKLLEQIDPSFTKELERISPTISKAEIRLATLISLGMDAPEIAQVLHISSASLYTLRYRLRRRLGLKSQDSLENFIDRLLSDKQ